MSSADRQSILARLWCYVSLLPQDLALAYTIHSRIPPELETLWVEFLYDLSEGRLAAEEAQSRYGALFADPATLAAAVRKIERSWSSPGMAVLRQMMERDIRALRLHQPGRAVLPAEAPSGSGGEPLPADGR
jgi:hypothetical protein